MKIKKITYKNFIQNKYLNKRLNNKYLKSYSDILNEINLRLDLTKDALHSLSKNFKLNFKKKDLINFKKFKTIVIVGMGGSILGSEAIYNFVRNTIKKDIIFFENIIKRESKNIILISEKNNNPFFLLAKKMKLFHIEHRSYIGGRYSVLSEVGMLPAYLMGLNIGNIRKNLTKHLQKKNKFYLKESSIVLANLIQTRKFKNLIFFNYAPRLNKFLFWNQQLIAESLGKKGKGFLPTISIAPKDHHSLLQLYLDGPKDKLFYIFSERPNNKKKLNAKIFGKDYNFLNKKSLSQIKTAQKKAFIKILKKKKIPFREFTIGDFSEENLGELLSYFILETIIIGKLSNTNPFDQPAVEQVKTDTKKLLI